MWSNFSYNKRFPHLKENRKLFYNNFKDKIFWNLKKKLFMSWLKILKQSTCKRKYFLLDTLTRKRGYDVIII